MAQEAHTCPGPGQDIEPAALPQRVSCQRTERGFPLPVAKPQPAFRLEFEAHLAQCTSSDHLHGSTPVDPQTIPPAFRPLILLLSFFLSPVHREPTYACVFLMLHACFSTCRGRRASIVCVLLLYGMHSAAPLHASTGSLVVTERTTIHLLPPPTPLLSLSSVHRPPPPICQAHARRGGACPPPPPPYSKRHGLPPPT